MLILTPTRFSRHLYFKNKEFSDQHTHVKKPFLRTDTCKKLLSISILILLNRFRILYTDVSVGNLIQKSKLCILPSKLHTRSATKDCCSPHTNTSNDGALHYVRVLFSGLFPNSTGIHCREERYRRRPPRPTNQWWQWEIPDTEVPSGAECFGGPTCRSRATTECGRKGPRVRLTPGLQPRRKCVGLRRRSSLS